MKLLNDSLKKGQIVYICDFRHNDIFNKPIRHIKPTKVQVVSNENLTNKTIYYSETHFKPFNKNGKLSSKIIAPFDNTGYRSFTGTCVNIFDNELDCIDCYKKQCESIIEKVQEGKEEAIERFIKMEELIKENITEIVNN